MRLRPPNPDPSLDALTRHLSTRDIHCKKCKYNLKGLTGRACPECGTTYMLAGGRLIRELNRFDFESEADSPCPTCGYDRTGLASPRCPECGYDPRLQTPPADEPSPIPPPASLPRVSEIHVADWLRRVRAATSWWTSFGHALGFLAVAVGFLAWFTLVVSVLARFTQPLQTKILLATGSAGIAALIGLGMSMSLNRQGGAKRAHHRRDAAQLLLAWLWAITALVALLIL